MDGTHTTLVIDIIHCESKKTVPLLFSL